MVEQRRAGPTPTAYDKGDTGIGEHSRRLQTTSMRTESGNEKTSHRNTSCLQLFGDPACTSELTLFLVSKNQKSFELPGSFLNKA